LALSDHDTHHVQVAVAAGLPDVVERLLHALVLADDERSAALGVPHPGELVKISLPLEQEVYGLRMSIVACVMQRSPLPIVESHNVSPFAEKQLQTLLAALSTSQVERRAMLFVFGLHVGA
jgi:hypothetical protein